MKILPLKFLLLAATFALSCPVYAAKNILVFGDSLSAGYGVARNASWVRLLQQELWRSHPQYEVANASISGETAAGGLRRIGKVLRQYQPAIAIIGLGANDGLRGAPLAEIEKNLDAIIARSRKVNARVLLLGMRLPPNYGLDYAAQFHELYSKLAKRHGITLVPFMLADIPPEQYQADNLHPNAAAQAQILRNVLAKLSPLLNAK